MHDGSIGSLADVIDHYAAGGRSIDEGPYTGEGFRSPFKSEFLRGFELDDVEKQDLLAFLGALTDQSIASNPAWSDPFLDRLRHSPEP
jgi:cytochrome c peroxidase